MWQNALPADVPSRETPAANTPLGYAKTTLLKGWQKTAQDKLHIHLGGRTKIATCCCREGEGKKM